MKHRSRTIVLSGILVMQFITAGFLSTTSATDLTAPDEYMMCGGGDHHFLSSEAYHNAMERYGLAAESAQSESTSRFEYRTAWGAIWK